jgi:hypothetical protein
VNEAIPFFAATISTGQRRNHQRSRVLSWTTQIRAHFVGEGLIDRTISCKPECLPTEAITSDADNVNTTSTLRVKLNGNDENPARGTMLNAIAA